MAPPPPIEEKITQGVLRTSDGLPLPLERTRVDAKIAGPIAEVLVEQVFHNPLDRAIEAVYLFPLPHDAAVHRLTFKLRSRTVEGVVKEREEARRVYERARSEGRAATLLEQDKPNLFTMSIANIAPGERVEVTLGYQEKLGFDDGEYRFVFPMVAMERHEPTPSAAPRRPRAKAPDERPADIGISVSVRAGVAIDPPRCLSHRVRTASFGVGSFTVSLIEEGRIPNRDFVLTYRASTSDVRPLVYLDRRPDKPGTFLLAITPPAEIAPAATRPRDLVFLLDRSCSMRGGSLPQARRAIRYILEGLPPGDRVAVIPFDHDRDTSLAMAPLTADRLAEIDRVLAALEPRGGTELERALEAAASALPREEGRTQLVVLVTDAAAGNEGHLLRRVPELLAGARLYVLGIGPAVNRYLVERLAREGGGASDVILPSEDIEPGVTRFRRRVIQGGPVLTDLAITWEGAHTSDIYPQPIPELFGGQPVQLVGRFAGAGPSHLVLTGKTATGAAFRQEADLKLPEESDEHPGLERLWARHRIDARLERLRAHPQEAADIRLEVIGLALKHAVASPYTSFVAVDSDVPETRPKQEPLRVDVPQGAPEGLDAPPTAAERLRGILSADGGGGPGAAREGRGGPMYSLELEDAAFSKEMPKGGVETFDDVMPRCIDMASSMAAAEFGFEDDDEATRVATGAPPAYSPPPGFAPPPPPAPAPKPAAPPRRATSLGYASSAAMKPRPGPDDMMSTRAGTLTASAPQAPPPEPAAPTIDAEPYPAELLAWAGQRPIGALDLVFLVDETGSMGAYIHEVQRHILHIIKAISASPLCKSLRIGLVGYRDHPPQERTFVTRGIPLTDDIPSIERGVMAMQASGGGDGPEAVTDGLFDVVRLGFRREATRTVIWIGDAPPHGVSLNGDGFPNGCPCGNHWYTQAESCREMGVIIHAVACQPGLAGYTGGEEVYRTVARTARGLYIPLSAADQLIPLITGMAESDLDKQRIAAAIEEQIAAHRGELGDLEEEERVERLTELLRGRSVRPRSLDIEGQGPSAAPALRFREITTDDVEAGLEALRREGRSDL